MSSRAATTHTSVCIRGEHVHADQQTIDQHPAPENGWDLVNNQYEIVWFEGLQLPDTLVPGKEDDQCEDDDSAVYEHGELSSENDDDDH